MATLGRVTPELDPPYHSATIREVEYEAVFDGRAGSEHIWGGVTGGVRPPTSGGSNTGHGRVIRRIKTRPVLAIFRDHTTNFELVVRIMRGATPSVSFRDLIALVCRENDKAVNLDVLGECRDMVENILQLLPLDDDETLTPMVPYRDLRRVLRIICAVIPIEVTRFRNSGDLRWLVTVLGNDEELMHTIAARDEEAISLKEGAAYNGVDPEEEEDRRFRGTTLSAESLDEFLVAGKSSLLLFPGVAAWYRAMSEKLIMGRHI
jgi:hypothetical protein